MSFRHDPHRIGELLRADLAPAGLGASAPTEPGWTTSTLAMSTNANWAMLPLGVLATVSGLTLAWEKGRRVPHRMGASMLLVTLAPAVALAIVLRPGPVHEAGPSRSGYGPPRCHEDPSGLGQGSVRTSTGAAARCRRLPSLGVSLRPRVGS